MCLHEWERATVEELEKVATPADVSEFHVLGTFAPRVFPGATAKHNAELTMLAEKLGRLRVITRRIEWSS